MPTAQWPKSTAGYSGQHAVRSQERGSAKVRLGRPLSQIVPLSVDFLIQVVHIVLVGNATPVSGHVKAPNGDPVVENVEIVGGWVTVLNYNQAIPKFYCLGVKETLCSE